MTIDIVIRSNCLCLSPAIAPIVPGDGPASCRLGLGVPGQAWLGSPSGRR